ncbi:glycoside hydrolase family protein [Kosakonia oryziphila]|uniref:glycoside hydrolase family protein n=1 Tax=Kosakonia oryziphila TaxID=1005667 RepID=UPI000B7CA758
MAIFEGLINHEVKAPLNQNQCDALLSCIFNVGPGKEGVKSRVIILKDNHPSILLRSLNNELYRDAVNAFTSWIYIGGMIMKDLLKRRKRERKLFLR